MKRFVVILFGLAILQACSSDDEETYNVDPGYSYFPLESGSFITYKADSIYHDHPVGIHDTISYFIKEQIDSLIQDGLDEPAYRLVRYKRQGESDEWELRDVWMVKLTNSNAQRVEEDRRYVNLAFPVSRFSSWDLNALNDLDPWPSSFDSLSVMREYGSLSFENTIRVNQRNFITAIDDEKAFEIYAEGVGLIERYHKDLSVQPAYLNNPVAENIIRGVEYHWEIMDYGQE